MELLGQIPRERIVAETIVDILLMLISMSLSVSKGRACFENGAVSTI